MDKAFQGTLVNRAMQSLHEGSLEITLTVSFSFLELSPRFKSFGSSLNSLNAALRPNLRPNSDDSLCHVIDSCEILGST